MNTNNEIQEFLKFVLLNYCNQNGIVDKERVFSIVNELKRGLIDLPQPGALGYMIDIMVDYGKFHELYEYVSSHIGAGGVSENPG